VATKMGGAICDHCHCMGTAFYCAVCNACVCESCIVTMPNMFYPKLEVYFCQNCIPYKNTSANYRECYTFYKIREAGIPELNRCAVCTARLTLEEITSIVQQYRCANKPKVRRRIVS